MEISRTQTVPAPVDVVWQALNDPDVLKACIPGCESLVKESEDAWTAVMQTRIGPVSARFTGRVKISDATPPTGYRLSFNGQGGAAGFANGEARVTLAPGSGATTALTYVAKAQVGGKLAQLGSRLIDGAAAKLADQFFACFAERLAPAEIATQAVAPTPVLQPGPGAKWVRYAAIIGIVLLLIVLYVNRAPH